MAKQLMERSVVIEMSGGRIIVRLCLAVFCLTALVATACYYVHPSWVSLAVGLALLVLLTINAYLLSRVRQNFRAVKLTQSQLSKEVDDRLVAQRKRDESRWQLSEAFDKAAIGKVVLSSKGILQRVNKAFASMLMYEASELLGQPISHFILEEDISGTDDLIASMRQGHTQHLEVEQRFRRRDGTVAFVRLHLISMDADAAEDSYLLGQIQDITAQKQAESKLRETLSLQQAILDSADRSIICTSPDGVIKIFNKAAERMLGYTAEEMVGKQTPAIIHIPAEIEAQVKELSAELGRPIEPGFDVFVARPSISCREEREWTYVRKDGSQFPVLLSITACRNDEGRLIAFVGIANDITVQKNAEAALRSAKLAAEGASRAKSEFLASMSHEIRTPMNGILGMTQLALQTKLDDDQTDLLNTIKDSADSLLIIINDILDFSKIEAGKLELDAVPFDLPHRLANAINSLAVKADQKGLKVFCEIDPEVPRYLVGDPDRLRQILINLVGNSIKFTSSGQIVIRVSRHDDHDDDALTSRLHFSVTDTGIGIAQDKQRQIFEAFSQADGSTTRKYGGTGLGLTISARLVDLMGGQIWVESQLGKGSTFHFTACFAMATEPARSLPQSKLSRLGHGIVTHHHDEASESIKSSREAIAPVERDATQCLMTARRKSLKILLAEDNRINQKLALRILEGDGHRVTVANHGNEVLSILETNYDDFDLILMDVHMPERDGLDTARHIRRREQPAGRRLPIIALTAYAMKGDDQQCLEAGMDAYLSKPFRIEDLRSVIDAVVPRAAPIDAPTCDWAAAVAAVDGEEALLREIAALLIEESPRWLQEIRESVEQRDAHRLQTAAHYLKGSLMSFNAESASESASTLEVMGRTGTFTRAETSCRQLELQVNELVKDLQKKLAEPGHANAAELSEAELA